MQVTDLLEGDAPASPAPVYLFCPGKPNARARETTFEPLLAERAAERLIKAYVAPENRDFAFGSFHADETRAESIVAEAQTLPFLAERRVILVRNAEKYAESSGEVLVSYLEDPSEFTVLLLIAGKIDKRTKFFKACEKSGEVIECPMLDSALRTAWVRNEVKSRDLSIDNDAVSALLSRAGTSLSDINNAIALAIDYVGTGAKRITEDDVNRACADVAEEIIWTLTDAISASNSGTAIKALRNLVDLGKHPDEIMGSINWLLKTAYQLASPETAGGVNRYVADKTRPLTQKLGRRKLEDALTLCTDTQFMMRETGVDAELALDLLVMKLAAPRRPVRGAAEMAEG